MSLSAIDDALEAYGNGDFLIVVDDEDRENEGDLIIAADAMTPEKMAFMIRHTSGVICAPMTEQRADELRLQLMVAENTESMRTAFTVSVDVLEGTSTGISASDRSLTVNALADTGKTYEHFARPGHIFPLKARAGGVLKRAGHTEAAIDLCQMTRRAPVGVLCELVNDDGTMSRLPDCLEFGLKHGLRTISIADLIRYRRRQEKLVERFASAKIPTRFGDFTAHGFRSMLDDIEHVAYTMGDVNDGEPVLVRVHSECLTGDLFGSLRCDCGSQLDRAIEAIGEAGRGVIVYLRGPEGRGVGLGHKLREYSAEDDGVASGDTSAKQDFHVDSREYGVGAQILADLDVVKMRVMTNNPSNYGGLEGYGLEVVDRVPLSVEADPANVAYLERKPLRDADDEAAGQ